MEECRKRSSTIRHKECVCKEFRKFVNTGMLVFDSEHKKNIWICGNTNRAWDIDFWKPLPQ